MNFYRLSSIIFLLDALPSLYSSEIWGEILAFVDVNYDRFTDLIVKRDQLLVVYRSITEETDLKFTERSKFIEDPSYNNDFTTKGEILNVAAGDFNADSYPDLLVSTSRPDNGNSHGAIDVTICWGSDKSLICDFSRTYTFKQQPLILNCDDDTITDFMAVSLDNKILCYQGKKMNGHPVILDPVQMSDLQNLTLLNSAHAFVDLTGDLNADLILQVDPRSVSNYTRAPIHPNLPVYQIYSRQGPNIDWKMDPDVQPTAPPPFPYSQDFPGSNSQAPDLFSLSDRFTLGNPIFDDFNRDGSTDLLTPVCQGPTSNRCQKFWLLVWSSGQRSWFWLSVENFHNLALGQASWWTFPQHVEKNSDNDNGIDENLVVRSGDYTQNGFPDILVVLAGSKNKSQAQAFFIENVPCVSPSQIAKNCTLFGRTFALSFTPLTPCTYVKTATFFDLGEDGTLDLLYECRNDTKPLDKFGYKAPPKYNIEFTNWNTDHDTTFLKVQTYTATCNYCPGGKEGTGISWPGVSLTYAMVDTEGQTVSAAYTQQSRTSHKSLLLPYALFGLGRSPNFVETMNIGVPQFPGAHQTWQQIVPNSRMYIVPYPAGEPSHWVGRLYVTPSRLILLSVSALGGVCLLILMMVIILQCYEMKQDKKERDVLKKRFHFDAM